MIILTTGYHDITASERFILFDFEKRILEVKAISQKYSLSNFDNKFCNYKMIMISYLSLN